MAFSLIRISIFLLLLAVACSSQTEIAARSETEKWHEDLRYMATEMEVRHINLFHTVSREKFEAAVRKLDSKIPSLGRNEIIVEMMKLVALIGDGHTNIYPTRDANIGFRTLPVQLYLFSDGMYVRSAERAHADIVGSRVEKIGGIPVSEAIDRVREVVGHDTEMGVRFFAPVLLAMPEVLNALGLAKSVDVATLTLNVAGRSRAVELKAAGPVEMAPADTDLSWMPKPGWVDMRDSAKISTPLWLRDPKNMFWFEYLPETKTLYAQVNQVGNKPDESLEAFSTRMFKFVDDNAVDRLILDLRLNRGGNGTLLRPLEIGLIKSKIDQRGKLFILMGRSTWSASQFFLNWTEKFTNVIFVGEPSASRGNVYGDSRRITLPNSGTTVRVSVYYWQDWFPWDTRKWTAPHVSAEMSSTQYAANLDPALQEALDYSFRKPLRQILEDSIREGGTDLAVKRYKEFKADPANKFAGTEEPLLIAGQVLLNEKKPDQALLLFLLNRDENPHSFRAFYPLGVAYAAANRKAHAITNLELALKMNPKNYDAHNLLRQVRGN